MLDNIVSCQNCKLRLYQAPLLDQPKKNAIMLVGLSAKQIKSPSEVPLDNRTKSGQLVASMEVIAKQYDLEIYRTNLVKCPPLDQNHKIRYPTQNEIEVCFKNILHELDILQPRLVVLLGNIVQSAFKEMLHLDIKPIQNCKFSFQQIDGYYYVASYHPSYIMRSTFRKKEYLENFSMLLKLLLTQRG